MDNKKNKGGRPKKALSPEEVLWEILEEADGDAVLIQQLMLKRGKELELNMPTVLKIARDLSSYQTPRKASIETKNEDTKNIILQYDFGQQLLDKSKEVSDNNIIEGQIEEEK